MNIFPKGSDPIANQDWSGESPSGESGSCHTRTPAMSPFRGFTLGTSTYPGEARLVDVELVVVELVSGGWVVSGLVVTTASVEIGAAVSTELLGVCGEAVEEHPADMRAAASSNDREAAN